MNTKILFLSIAISSIFLSSCSKESIDDNTGAIPVKIQSISIKADSQTQPQAFALEGDQIGIQTSISNNSPILFTYTNGKWVNNNGDSYVFLKLPSTLFGFFPNDGYNSINLFMIPDNQSDEAKLHQADFMVGETTITSKDTPLDFKLKHKLCKVIFNVTTYGDEFGGVAPVISSPYIISQNAVVGSNAPNNRVSGKISPLITTLPNGMPSYTAIVSPAVITPQRPKMMELTVNGKRLNVLYKSDNNFNLEEGSVYTFNLKVGKDIATISSVTITPWISDIPQSITTSNVALPDAGNSAAGIFIYYGDNDSFNVDNQKISTTNNFTIEKAWKSLDSAPLIAIYSPYDSNVAFSTGLPLNNGTDYCATVINADASSKVSSLLTENGILTIPADKYTHLLSHLTIDFGSLTPTSVKINKIHSKATYSFLNGGISFTDDAAAQDLALTNGKCELYAVPQVVYSDDWFITAIINGIEYKYLYDNIEGFKLNSNEHITLKLTIPTVTVTSRSISNKYLKGTITYTSWK